MARPRLIMYIQVALFTRAWIEIDKRLVSQFNGRVALFTRAWIEIEQTINVGDKVGGRPLHEGVD